MSDKQTDNGDPQSKIALRLTAAKLFKDKPRVLDCYAGEGHMYRNVWRDNSSAYMGMDKKYSRTSKDPRGLCFRGDNARLIERAMRQQWDIVDLDAYSNPWVLLRQVLRRSTVDRLVIIATCGIERAMQTGSSDFAASISGCKMSYLGLLGRWYDDVVRWALAWSAGSTGYKITRARRIQASHSHRMRYWLLEFERNADG